MLLVVDVGNTQTHLGTYEGDRLVEHWRFATVRSSTADELGAALRALLALRGMGFGDIDASIVSSTVPQLRPEWTEMARRYLGHPMPVGGVPGRGDLPGRRDLRRGAHRPRRRAAAHRPGRAARGDRQVDGRRDPV